MDKELTPSELKFYLKRFYAYKERGWSSKTKRNYSYCLNKLTEFLGERNFNRENVEELLNIMREEKKSESTIKQVETYIKAFITWLYDEEVFPRDWGRRIERTKVHRKARVLPTLLEALELIYKVTEPHGHKQHRFSQLEHRACLAFMLIAGGTRNFETRHILTKDVAIVGREVMIQEAKGGNPQVIPLPEVPWLIADLAKRVKGRSKKELDILDDPTHYMESDKERLFVVNETKLQETMRKAGKLWGHRLVVHDLRRIFANDLKNNGAQDSAIKSVMRHKTIETTLRYLEFNTADRKKTLQKYSTMARLYLTPEDKSKDIVEFINTMAHVETQSLKGEYLLLKVKVN